MICGIDNGLLVTDLDAAGFSILNVDQLVPVPPNLVDTTDTRLTDAREPLFGSVTNASVAAGAAIYQDKLNLNGDIPTNWLGTTATKAAQGDLVEYLLNKDQPGGYAGLDGSGQIGAAQLPPDVGVGTITSVDLTMPTEFAVTGNPVTTSGTLAVAWNATADGSWFGNATGGAAVPSFTTDPLPVSLIPDLDASKITSGTIAVARLPAAVGVGGGHSAGLVPDPGAAGDATDYLARDMTYHTAPTLGAAYQPAVQDPVLTSSFATVDGHTVVISNMLTGATYLYKTTTTVPTYVEVSGSTVFVPTGEEVSVYGAKSGYTNSSEVTLTP